jgi:hypothetical protein
MEIMLQSLTWNITLFRSRLSCCGTCAQTRKHNQWLFAPTNPGLKARQMICGSAPLHQTRLNGRRTGTPSLRMAAAYVACVSCRLSVCVCVCIIPCAMWMHAPFGCMLAAGTFESVTSPCPPALDPTVGFSCFASGTFAGQCLYQSNSERHGAGRRLDRAPILILGWLIVVLLQGAPS